VLEIEDRHGYKSRRDRLPEQSTARHKHHDSNQTKMIPLSSADPIIEWSFEFALNEIVEAHLDVSVFEHRYHNHE
jgi:hypothetical protein